MIVPPNLLSACPPVPHKQLHGGVGAPFTVIQPIAESKRDDPTPGKPTSNGNKVVKKQNPLEN